MNTDMHLPALPPVPQISEVVVYEGLNAELTRRDAAARGVKVRAWFIDKRLMPKEMALRAARQPWLPPSGRVEIGICQGHNTGEVPVVWVQR